MKIYSGFCEGFAVERAIFGGGNELNKSEWVVVRAGGAAIGSDRGPHLWDY